jgi:hypothetical protein
MPTGSYGFAILWGRRLCGVGDGDAVTRPLLLFSGVFRPAMAGFGPAAFAQHLNGRGERVILQPFRESLVRGPYCSGRSRPAM